MRSRLDDLRGGQGGNGQGTVEMSHVAIDMPPMDGSKAGKSDKFMADFFAEVEAVKEGITAIKSAAKRVGAITEERMLAVSNATEQKLSKELNPLVDATNAEVKATKAILVRLAEETEAHRPQMKASEIRIRENLTNTLQRKFVEVAKEYQQQQTRYKSEVTKTVRRQLEIVKPDVTADEIDAVLRSGNTSEVYRSAILKGAADPIKSAYVDVADKYQDVLKLEQSVAELHQMFVDFALLTEQQGELIDQIEYQVKSASEYIDDGNTDIEYAIKYQADIRKRYCCILVILLIVIVVALAFSGVFNQAGK